MLANIIMFLSSTILCFSAGYHLDYQLSYPNRFFKTIKLKGKLSKLFIFRNKYRVMKVALFPQILGYVLFIIGLIFNIVFFLNRNEYNVTTASKYFNFTFITLTILIIYVLMCFMLDKIFEKSK